MDKGRWWMRVDKGKGGGCGGWRLGQGAGDAGAQYVVALTQQKLLHAELTRKARGRKREGVAEEAPIRKKGSAGREMMDKDLAEGQHGW